MNDMRKIKDKISTITHQEHISLHSSGTDALYEILKTLKIKKTEAVLVPSFACERILLPFLRLNIKVILVDVHPQSITPHLQEYQSAFTSKTKVLLLVYPWGYIPEDLFHIVEWANRNSILIIEDVASAFGLSFRGVKLGKIGEYCFGSFGHDKFCSIGAIGFSNLKGKDSFITNSKTKLSRLLPYNVFIKILRKKQFKLIRPFILYLVSKFFITSFSGVDKTVNLNLLLTKLQGYSTEVIKRRRSANLYLSHLSNVVGLRILHPNNDQSVALRVACIFNSYQTRDKVILFAARKRFWLGRDYSVPLHNWIYVPVDKFRETTCLQKKIVNLVTNPVNQHGKEVIVLIKKMMS